MLLSPKILPFTRLDLAREILSALNYSSSSRAAPADNSKHEYAMTFYPFGVIASLPCFQTHAILEVFSSIPGISQMESASPAPGSPFPVGMSPGAAPGAGTAGLDPAPAPGSTSQPAWPWNAGEASSNARKNPERGKSVLGIPGKTVGLSFLRNAGVEVVARPGSAPRGACWLHPCGSHQDLSPKIRSLWRSQTCSKVCKGIKVSRGSFFLPHGDQLESGVPEAAPPWPNPKICSFPWKIPFHGKWDGQLAHH